MTTTHKNPFPGINPKMEFNAGPFDPFKAYHDQQPPIEMTYLAPGATLEQKREEFNKFAIGICQTVDYRIKKVNVYGVCGGKEIFKVIIYNPLRNPELIIH